LRSDVSLKQQAKRINTLPSRTQWCMHTHNYSRIHTHALTHVRMVVYEPHAYMVYELYVYA